MGQRMSLTGPEDRLSLFHSLSDSTNSVVEQCSLHDHLDDKSRFKKKFKMFKKFKIKNCVTDCFNRSRDLSEEVEDNDGEMMNVQRSKTEARDPGAADNKDNCRNSQELQKEIHEVHDQLSSLMTLLSQTDLSSRDVSCQTTDHDVNVDNFIRQRDSLILNQQDKLNTLHLELESKNRTIERYMKEINILKSHYGRQRTDYRNQQDLITFLKSFKQGKTLHSNDLSKVNDIIELLTYSCQTMKTQVEKNNVAVINPCSNFRKAQNNVTLSEDTAYSHNSFLSLSKDSQETKLICFLDHSVTPYISTIPLSSSRITLSHVKHYTKSALPTNAACRYIFKSMTPGSPQTQEEITQDSDYVPVHDNKIVVRIRM